MGLPQDLQLPPPRRARPGHRIGAAVADRLLRFVGAAGNYAASLVSVDASGHVTTPGRILAAANTDTYHILGRVRLSFLAADEASFAHLSYEASPAIRQNAVGATVVSCDPGESVKAGPSGYEAEFKSTEFKVVLPMRLKGYTTAARDALPAPQAGWIIFNTSTGKLNFYNGTIWEAVTSA